MCSPSSKTEERTSQFLISIFSREQLSSAGQSLLSIVVDFKRLHIRMPGHAGIIICTEDPDRIGQAQRIAEAIAEAGDLRAKLIRVYRPTSARY
jgi:hypothetical protein